LVISEENNGIQPFFIVCARDLQNVKEKIVELEQMKVPFLIVCGEKTHYPHVVYRKARGKWDAINFGARFVPDQCNVIVLNDVDTKIYNFEKALLSLNGRYGIIYCKVKVSSGPQVKFYKLLDPIRGIMHVAASGEIMLIKRTVWKRVLPIPPCIAEDSYILFRALELCYQAHFCSETYVTTERTADSKREEEYKARTTLGIYQALTYTKPPIWIRLFYLLLPVAAPLLGFAGEDGRAWTRGIEKAVDALVQKRFPTKF
jgi:hypothetical protein